ncbi:Scr1 family TA system antitoxin-like transcriptional regulator [Micromonospora echinofusca]|uniref:Scr1 family TA system antitoxin-like transcriptional regulator n=1 Tax=Micromonospora echinofusca TaxID=47858 RepID=UPI0033E5A8A2
MRSRSVRCLARDAPPQLVAVIDEVVLRRRVGDRAVTAGQLAHLLAVAAQEHVQVRVIPAEAPWHTGLAGPFVLIRLPDGAETAYRLCRPSRARRLTGRRPGRTPACPA